jgi:hypothetical protein
MARRQDEFLSGVCLCIWKVDVKGEVAERSVRGCPEDCFYPVCLMETLDVEDQESGRWVYGGLKKERSLLEPGIGLCNLKLFIEWVGRVCMCM